MGQGSIERLREYFARLSPAALARTLLEFERAVERGDDPGHAAVVLAELRKVIRNDETLTTPRGDEPPRMVFGPLEPFLVDGDGDIGPGEIRRSSLTPLWHWLAQSGAPDAVRDLKSALERPDVEVSDAFRTVRRAIAEAIRALQALPPGHARQNALHRIGAAAVVEDARAIALVLDASDSLEAFGVRIPASIRNFGDSQVASVVGAMNGHGLQAAPLLPFAFALVMQRLAAPWQVVRLPVRLVSSDDESRIAPSPSGVAVTMAIHDLMRIADSLRADLRRGRFAAVSESLKVVHDAVRGLRTELDIRADSPWGRQLASIRTRVSDALKSEIESVPGRVRRLLRQRPDREASPGQSFDELDVEETEARIGLVAACRNYASELAINEVTLRTYSELQQYVEQATEALVASIRNADAHARGFRRNQMQAAIRFCDVLFGADYASLMQRAAENAEIDARRALRVG